MVKIYYLHYKDKIPFYIGKTTNVYHRIINHKKKFGNDVELTVIVENNNWRFWEKFYINLYKNLGYKLLNKNSGGGGLESWTNESIEKIKNHPTRGSKISKTSKGMTKSHKGRKFTEEHKQKIKNTRNFLKNRSHIWQYKPVLQYSLDGVFIKEFGSGKEAAYIMNVKGDGIGACCRNKQKTAYGYIWKFKN
jgi:hypothetical protein